MTSWHRKEKPIRQQLAEAIEECARQLQILRRSDAVVGSGGGSDKSREIRLMEIEQQRLTETLKELGPDDS